MSAGSEKRLFWLLSAFTIFIAVLLGYELANDSGKSTARFTAALRYSSTFHPFPMNIRQSNGGAILGYDGYAQYFIFPSIKWAVSSPFIRWLIYQISNYLPSFGGFGHVIARHFIIDEVMAHEIESNGAQQVVILGAGYDSRALRFDKLFTEHNIAVFEVDLPATQFWKKSLLESNGIDVPEYVTFVGVEFGEDDTKQILTQNGYDATKQTVFIFEGVSIVSDVMKIVSQFSGEKSLIIWDTIHRCLGYPFGAFDDKLSDKDRDYCLNHGMDTESNVIYQFFLSVLKEPIHFAPDWNVIDGENSNHNMDDTKDGYYHVVDLQADNCLNTERIFNFADEQKYLEWTPSNRTLLRVAPGMAVVVGRKREMPCNG